MDGFEGEPCPPTLVSESTGIVLGDKDGWALDYQTEITNDVLGHLTESDVVDLLKRIQALPPAAGEA